ncbi:MAG: TolC family protein, partial [Pontiellaceae bacterium]|nr:TolC family protein [Pontiellaceae bacterium]
YNFHEEVGGVMQDNSYMVGAGVTIKRFDKSVLLYTIKKADADIYYIEKTMDDRRREMSYEITEKKASLLITKDQVLSSRTTLDSWKKIHDQKKDEFLRGAETADNYIQSFRTLVDTTLETLEYENDYFDTIRDFDYICGVYFRTLGINPYQWTGK